MRHLPVLLLFSLMIGQLSCSGGLESNRRRWRESGVTNYRMSVKMQKTGHATPSGSFVITVRDGVARSIKRADDPASELIDGPIKFGSYSTVDRIFDYIASMEKEEGWTWNRREAEYDPKLGYPRRVNFDAARVSDEELLFEVLEFEVQ